MSSLVFTDSILRLNQIKSNQISFESSEISFIVFCFQYQTLQARTKQCLFSYVNDSAITSVMILIFQVLGTKYIITHKNGK